MTTAIPVRPVFNLTATVNVMISILNLTRITDHETLGRCLLVNGTTINLCFYHERLKSTYKEKQINNIKFGVFFSQLSTMGLLLHTLRWKHYLAIHPYVFQHFQNTSNYNSTRQRKHHCVICDFISWPYYHLSLPSNDAAYICQREEYYFTPWLMSLTMLILINVLRSGSPKTIQIPGNLLHWSNQLLSLRQLLSTYYYFESNNNNSNIKFNPDQPQWAGETGIHTYLRLIVPDLHYHCPFPVLRGSDPGTWPRGSDPGTWPQDLSGRTRKGHDAHTSASTYRTCTKIPLLPSPYITSTFIHILNHTSTLYLKAQLYAYYTHHTSHQCACWDLRIAPLSGPLGIRY